MQLDSSPSSAPPPACLLSCGWLYLYLGICLLVRFMTETATHCRHVAKVILSLDLVENIERILENKV